MLFVQFSNKSNARNNIILPNSFNVGHLSTKVGMHVQDGTDGSVLHLFGYFSIGWRKTAPHGFH